jgi:DNA modification methylase
MVTPYYQGERATLYLGDCRDVVPTLPRQSVDLIVADPPYGMSWQSGRRQVPFEQMAGDDGTVDWPSVIGNTMRHVYNWSRVNRAKGSGRLAARLRQGFVLHVPRPVSRQVRHPAEKPVELVRQLIESSSCLGETVFDPTCGVGSVPVAAVLAGRHAIGIESDDRYLSIAVDRLREAERIAKLAEVC